MRQRSKCLEAGSNAYSVIRRPVLFANECCSRTPQSRSRFQIKKQEFDIASLEANESQSSALLSVQIETNNAQAMELSDRRDRTREQHKQLMQLAQRVSELDNDNEALTRQLRYYQEEIVAMGQATMRLDGILRKIPDAVREQYTGGAQSSAVIESPVNIDGQVTAIRPFRDDTFVEVDVGRTSGV